MITALVVDDDEISLQFLEMMLKTHFSNLVQVIGTAKSVSEAIQKIEFQNPDLIFLDIYLPEKDGFQLFEELKIVNFEVIVTTGNKSFAFEAFKINAIDFLVKPISINDLKNAIVKAYNKIKIESKTPKIGNNKIGLPTSRGIVFVNPDYIIYCEADNNYTTMHLSSGSSESISRTLKDVESVLVDYNFFRIHKSYLINFARISQIIKSDGGFIIMDEYKDVQLPISKHVKEYLSSNLKII